jgi:hypothetical protein
MRSVFGRAVAAFSFAVVLSAAAVGCGGGGSSGGFFGSSVDGTKTTVTVDRPTGVLPNGVDAATVTVTALNSNGTPVSGVTIVVTGPAGVTVAATTSTLTTGLSGIATFKVTSTTEGTKILQAAITSNGTTIDVAQFVTITFSSVPATGAASTSVTVSPAVVVADNVTTETITVQARDVTGADITGATVTFAPAMGTSGLTLSAPTATTDANGNASITVTSTVAGPATVNITVQNGTGTPTITLAANLQFVPGAAVAIQWLTQPSNTVAADFGPYMVPAPQVAAVDQFGNFTGAGNNMVQVHIVTASGKDLGPVNLAGGVTNVAAPGTVEMQAGVATFNYVCWAKASTFTLVAKTTALGSVTSTPFTVSAAAQAAAPAGLQFVGTVANTVNNSAAIVCSVSACDRFLNNIATAGTSIIVNVTNLPASTTYNSATVGTLTSLTAMTGANGLAVFSTNIGTTNGTPDSLSFTATEGARTALSNTFTLTPAGPAPAAGSRLFLVSSPATAVSNATINVTAIEVDSAGAPVVGDDIGITVVSSPISPYSGIAGANLNNQASVPTGAGGTFTFTPSFDVAGVYTLKFVGAGTANVLPSPTFTITVTAGPASKVAFLDFGVLEAPGITPTVPVTGIAGSVPHHGEPHNIKVGGNLGNVQVAVLDQFNNIAAVATNTPVSVALNGFILVGITLNGTTTVVTTNGIATFADLTVTGATAPSVFPYTLTASVVGSAFTTATSNNFTIHNPLSVAGTVNNSNTGSSLAFTREPVNVPNDFFLSASVDVEASVLDSVGAVVTGDSTDSVAFNLYNPGNRPAFPGSLLALAGVFTVTAGNGRAESQQADVGSDLGVSFFETAFTGTEEFAVSTPFDFFPAAPLTLAIKASPNTGGLAMPQVQNNTVIGSTQSQPASQPSTGVSPGPFYQVAIVDDSNSLVSTSSLPVTVTITSGNGSFTAGSTTTVNAVDGVATFRNLILVGTSTLPAAVTLRFDAPGMTSTTAMINVTN